ncbi:hypothetical protein ABZX40_13510 [Streptomyces sp. NPDC004610]|uniref:hypothetical protein n=1 Tax=unclassified Streptomyces TaxID=2593676 RepID=UPI0033BB97A0
MLTYPHTDGQHVTYHGTITSLHGGTYRAWICRCRRAHAVDQPRFTLTRPGSPKIVANCVRPTSLNPA